MHARVPLLLPAQQPCKVGQAGVCQGPEAIEGPSVGSTSLPCVGWGFPLSPAEGIGFKNVFLDILRLVPQGVAGLVPAIPSPRTALGILSLPCTLSATLGKLLWFSALHAPPLSFCKRRPCTCCVECPAQVNLKRLFFIIKMNE